MPEITDAPPTVSAKTSLNGRQLIVCCPYCGREHFHGRHLGGTPDCELTRRPHHPRARCTCPVGHGDGHRSADCCTPRPRGANRGYLVREIRN